MRKQDERRGIPREGYVGIDAEHGDVVLEFPGATHFIGLSPGEALEMAIKLIEAVQSLARLRSLQREVEEPGSG